MSKKRTVKQIAATKRMREALAAKRAGKKAGQRPAVMTADTIIKILADLENKVERA